LNWAQAASLRQRGEQGSSYSISIDEFNGAWVRYNGLGKTVIIK